MFLERFRKRFGSHVPGTVRFGEVSVDVPDIRIIQAIPIQNTRVNLEMAIKKGLRPLTLRGVLSQVEREVVDSSVLFDTPPVSGIPGNHWRVVDIDPQRGIGMLQLCGTFGNYDYDQMPPVEVDFETPMFTGLSHQRFAVNGKLLILKVVQEMPEGIEYQGEVVYWVNATGNLLPSWG